MPGKWLSLKEVAELLGVHPSTVRNWANQGVIPVHRTQGGHRRFHQDEIALWEQSQRLSNTEESNGLFQNALKFARVQISEAHLEKEVWYQKIDESGRATYKLSGRTLAQGLMKSQVLDDEAAEAEARAIGSDYASNGRRYGLTVLEAVQAFLFFRNVLQEAAYHAYESAAIQSPYAWGNMFRNLNAFTDNILVAILEAYNAFEQGKRDESSKINSAAN